MLEKARRTVDYGISVIQTAMSVLDNIVNTIGESNG